MRSQMSTSRLLAAAAELFADRGYRQTSLADIGERAGYGRGLVTRRFGSKQGLIVALLDHMIDVWMQGELLPAVANETGVAGIRRFFAAFCANARANSSNLRALESLMFEGLWGEAEVRERLTIIQQRGQELFCDLIHAGLKDGSVRPDVNVEAISLMASAGSCAAQPTSGCWKRILTSARRSAHSAMYWSRCSARLPDQRAIHKRSLVRPSDPAQSRPVRHVRDHR